MHNISCHTKDFILQSFLVNISRNVAIIRRTSCIRFK